MRAFTSMLALVLCLCACGAAHGQQATAIVAALKDLSARSDALRTQIDPINALNAPTDGQQIPQGLGQIVQAVNSAGSMLSDDQATLQDADAKLVVTALTSFVKIHQRLLIVVIDKHNIVSLFPYFETTRAVLAQLQSSFDNYAFFIDDKIRTQASAANTQFNSLKGTVDQAINTYSTFYGTGRKLLK